MNLEYLKSRITQLFAARVLASLLSFFLFSFLLSYILISQENNSFALRKIDHTSIPLNTVDVAVSANSDCSNFAMCYQATAPSARWQTVPKSGSFLDLSSLGKSIETSTIYAIVRFNLSNTPKMIAELSDTLVINFPEVNYNRAEVHMNGRVQRYYYSDQNMFFVFDKAELSSSKAHIDLLLETTPEALSTLLKWDDPFFIAQGRDYRKYIDQINLIQLGQGAQIGMIARIVLATLMLIFFVILDSSNSALGLAMVMGFEAAGMCLGNVSLRHQWLSNSDFWYVTKLTFYTLSDFMGLYFLLTIAGFKRISMWVWFMAGAIVGVSYGTSMLYFSNYLPGIHSFWIPRQLGTIGVGVVFCSLSLIKSIKSREVWKLFAIIFALLGMGVVIIDAIGGIFPSFSNSESISLLMSVGKAAKAYLLTLSGLAGIAHARVELAALEVERAKSRKMSHELQLGREMQEALLLVPELPAGIEIATSHIPAAYVSGDTYFFDWNSTAQVFTVLLNDVPGHGLQAALKAYACNVIAKTVWSQGPITNDRRRFRSLFPIYQEQVVEMLKHQKDSKPFNAFTGVEIFFEHKLAIVHRNNYNEPLLIVPEEHGYKVSVLSSRSGEPLEVPLTPGLCILLISDGLIPSSKVQKRFVEQLKAALNTQDGTNLPNLSTQELLQLLLDPKKIAKSHVDDDQTIVVVRWTGKTAQIATNG